MKRLIRKAEQLKTGIYLLKTEDVTSPYFVKWLFQTDEFKDIGPEKFNFDEVIYDDKTGNYPYGYFDNGKLEGIIRLTYTDGDDFYGLSFLYINPKKWNNGIGTSLIKFALKKYGNNKLILNVAENNKKAISIYKKFGFKITRFIKDTNENDNFFVMERNVVKDK